MNQTKQSRSWKTEENKTKRHTVIKAGLLCRTQWTVE